jgi:hypothetical protein
MVLCLVVGIPNGSFSNLRVYLFGKSELFS